ncbi:hypothetical protein AB0P15_29555 [Streptomyces sp. NPDC087917]|uniref:hypothetical protein n=1 Tax=Streptomyces sp. NPDC087917 TaxID=3155060 RepID=UPI003429F0D8
MTFSFCVERILGDRSFAEIGHPNLAIADKRRGLVAVAGTHGFSDHPTVGIYDTASLSCHALLRSRYLVHAMAFHPTLPLVAVGTGSYDGGYFFHGDLLLLNLETEGSSRSWRRRMGVKSWSWSGSTSNGFGWRWPRPTTGRTRKPTRTVTPPWSCGPTGPRCHPGPSRHGNWLVPTHQRRVPMAGRPPADW